MRRPITLTQTAKLSKSRQRFVDPAPSCHFRLKQNLAQERYPALLCISAHPLTATATRPTLRCLSSASIPHFLKDFVGKIIAKATRLPDSKRPQSSGWGELLNPEESSGRRDRPSATQPSHHLHIVCLSESLLCSYTILATFTKRYADISSYKSKQTKSAPYPHCLEATNARRTPVNMNSMPL